MTEEIKLLLNRDCLYRYITLCLTLKLNQNINLFGSFWWFRAGRHIDGGLTLSVTNSLSVFIFSATFAHFVHAPMIIICIFWETFLVFIKYMEKWQLNHMYVDPPNTQARQTLSCCFFSSVCYDIVCLVNFWDASSTLGAISSSIRTF